MNINVFEDIIILEKSGVLFPITPKEFDEIGEAYNEFHGLQDEEETEEEDYVSTEVEDYEVARAETGYREGSAAAEIINLLTVQKKPMLMRDIKETLGISQSSVAKALNVLFREGRINKKGSKGKFLYSIKD